MIVRVPGGACAVVSVSVTAVLISACSALVDGGGGEYPNAPSLALTPDPVRRGDLATVAANGSIDPRGTEVRYRFEWFSGASAEPERTEVADSADTLGTFLSKGDQWMVRATPLTSDGREGATAEYAFTVGNTPPTVETVSLNSYRPLEVDTVSAVVVGYHDVDGDVDQSRLVWTIGERAPITTMTGELDFGTLSSLAESETWTLDVVPSDGDDDGQSITLGPFPIAPDVTMWRALSPTRFIGATNLGNMVNWDDRHRRFIASSDVGAYLWEYSPGHGFVQLRPSGLPPGAIGLVETAYDATPGAERLFVLGTFGPGTLQLFAIELHDRGLEEWVEIPLPESGGPQTVCGYNAHFDEESRYLLIYGGTSGFCQPENTPLNELWLLDLNDPSDATWVKLFSFAEGRFLARMVEHPTEDNALLLFGGFDGPQSPAGVLRLEYDFSDPEDLYAETGSSGLNLSGGPLGAFALPDQGRGLVAGGLGVNGVGEPVESIWVYDASSGAGDPFSYPASEVFQTFDTSLGASRGSGGWDGDRILLFPGQTSLNNRSFRLLEVVHDGERYVWGTLVERGIHYPANPQQIVLEGNTVLVTTNEATPWFQFELNTRDWRQAEFEVAPPPRGGVNGGTALDGSLWMFGGFSADMQPWRYADGAWEEIAVTGPVPEPRDSLTIFDPGCGPDTPIAFFGGKLASTGSDTNETWLLRCPPEAAECQWEQVGGAAPAPRYNALIAYDGRKYTVLYGGSDFVTPQISLRLTDAHRLDACTEAPSGWEPISPSADPVHGVPLNARERSFTRIPVGPDPQFLHVAGKQGWWLREIASDNYAWERSMLSTQPDCSGLPAVWDAAQSNLLQFCAEAAVWEFRYRPE